MVCHSLLQWTTFCQTSPPWPAHLGWPHMAWLSFIELDKAVVHVIRLTSFLWLWFQCVCPLTPSCNTYRLTWVSLTLDVGYLFMAAPQWGTISHRSEWLLPKSLQTINAGEGVGEEGMLLHCWWECKLIQSLQKPVWRFLKNLGRKPPYDPAIPLLGIYPGETKIETDTCTPMFIAALFTIASTWK